MTEKLSRIDPQGCGCTDCLTGYSRPAMPGEEEGPYTSPEDKLRELIQEAINAASKAGMADGKLVGSGFKPEGHFVAMKREHESQQAMWEAFDEYTKTKES